jgi:hypothetical protein
VQFVVAAVLGLPRLVIVFGALHRANVPSWLVCAFVAWFFHALSP